MGIRVASQKTKNRNRSRATNTPIMLISRSSMKTMYSFTLSVMAVQEDRMAMGLRRVVSSTRKRLMPSTPR